MPKRYYIAYITALLGGALFFISGFYGRLPDVSCLFYMTSGYPCPSCGLTRSVSLAFSGDITGSLAMHPFGIFTIVGIATATLLSAYGLIERSRLTWLFGKRLTAIAIAAVIVYIAVWIIRLCE